MLLAMQEKSAELITKFLSFSEDVHKITVKLHGQTNVDVDRLDNTSSVIDSLLIKARRELMCIKK